MFILRWFLSKTVREATTTRRHVERLLRAQRDLLSPAAVQAVAPGYLSPGHGIARMNRWRALTYRY